MLALNSFFTTKLHTSIKLRGGGGKGMFLIKLKSPSWWNNMI